MSFHDTAIQILKDAGKPLHVKEIVERIIEAGLWSSDGKTPEVTVKKYLTVRQEGNREAKCHFYYYIPDLIGGHSSLSGQGCTKVGGQSNG